MARRYKVWITIMLMSWLHGTSTAIRARTSGMLATMLVLIVVDLTPEEIPLFDAGTEPMMELAFGRRNRPMPTPTRTRPSAICG